MILWKIIQLYIYCANKSNKDKNRSYIKTITSTASTNRIDERKTLGIKDKNEILEARRGRAEAGLGESDGENRSPTTEAGLGESDGENRSPTTEAGLGESDGDNPTTEAGLGGERRRKPKPSPKETKESKER